MSRKKGQEEIVGFVLIVVIIAIVFVIFLGIKLRSSEPVQKESEIIYQFVESSMRQTTECVIRQNGRNVVLNELIRECYSYDNSCLNGVSSCDVAKNTIINIINSTWKVGSEEYYKGYVVDVFYSQNVSLEKKEIFLISEGNCSDSYIANSYFIPSFPGRIVMELKVCN